MERRILEPLFFVAILLGTIGLAFLMFRPFLFTLIFAGILAFLTNDTYRRLAARIHSPSGAAAIMTLFVFVALLVPLTLIGLRITYEAASTYSYLSEPTTQVQLHEGLNWLQRTLDEILPGVEVNAASVNEQLGVLLNWLVGSLGSILGSFLTLLINFFLLLLFYFYLVRDGSRLKERLKVLSPLGSDQEEEVLSRVGRAITATVRGSLVLALLQGLVAGLGFVIFGIPNPALWGTAVMLAAFIPVFGTSLVQIPAVLFLVATGHIPQAIGLALWAAIAVGMLDNILIPHLMARGARMHPMVILLAILGGIGFYGPLGILFGPITVALLYALLDIYISMIREPSAEDGH